MKLEEMKYVKTRKLKDGKIVYDFRPPADVASAGVVKNQTFRDGRTALVEVPKLIEKVDAYRRGDIVEGDIGPKSKLKHLCRHYLNSKQFALLSSRTQVSYEYELKSILNTSVGAKKVGDIRLNNLDAKTCRLLYNTWVEEISIATANTKKRVFSVFLNYLWSLDLIVVNPMAKVRPLKHEPTTYLWTHKQVMDALDVAFEDFETRNVGLIILMCYEWAQRPADIRGLTWDNFDENLTKLTLTQSKRGAQVQLPVPENLREMLLQQKEDWGFQKYVVPHHKPSGGVYKKMNVAQMTHALSKVKEKADLPQVLQIGYLRKTAINELVESGVDAAGIMPVTGHKSISSLNPYFKHTYEAAKNTLERRKRL